MSAPAFGQEMKQQQFSHLLPNVAFLNQGSYGTPSKWVKDAQQAMLGQYDSDSDTFRRRLASQYWDTSRQAIAVFLGTTAGNVALTVNTTTGINAVLKSLIFQPGDAILQNVWTYGAVKNTIAHVAEKNPGLEVIEVKNQYPITSTQQIIEEYETVLDANPNIKLAVIDHIVSIPSILFPVVELIAACKSRGVMVLIDGAHGAGQIPLNLDGLGADFYTSSLHKWMYCARGCGILYVNPAYHDVIKPSITSFGYNDGFPQCFYQQGTRDDVPLYQCTAGIDFYEYAGGMSAISLYIGDLLARVSDMLTVAWGTDKFDMPVEMEAPFMKNIRLPDLPAYPVTAEGASQLFNDLRDVYEIWSPIRFENNQLFVRISGQIYITDADFQRLRDAIVELSIGRTRPRKRHNNKPYFVKDIEAAPAPFLGKYKPRKSKMCVIQ